MMLDAELEVIILSILHTFIFYFFIHTVNISYTNDCLSTLYFYCHYTIDEFVTFSSLGMDQLGPIVALELKKVEQRLADRKLSLSITDDAKMWLAERGYDPVYGARPLKRTIQREVETPIAQMILGGGLKDNDTVLLDAKAGDEKLTITAVGHLLPATTATSGDKKKSTTVKTTAGAAGSKKKSMIVNADGNDDDDFDKNVMQ